MVFGVAVLVTEFVPTLTCNCREQEPLGATIFTTNLFRHVPY